MPSLPLILSLDVKSLLIRAPSTHETSSPTSPSLGCTYWLEEGTWQWRLCGGWGLFSFPHPLTCGQSIRQWCSLAHWVPPESRVLLWVLGSGCPSGFLPTYFWYCGTCTIFLFPLVPSPGQISWFSHFLLLLSSFLSLGGLNGVVTIGEFV